MNMKERKLPFLRTPYNYDVDKVSDETGLKCEDPTLAQQQFAEESDINYIMDRFGVTGQMPVTPLSPQYGDFTQVMDYHSALNAVLAAQDAFMDLPPNIRARFENDPNKLIEFMNDESNREEAKALGLTQEMKPISTPVETPIVGQEPNEAQ